MITWTYCVGVPVRRTRGDCSSHAVATCSRQRYQHLTTAYWRQLHHYMPIAESTYIAGLTQSLQPISRARLVLIDHR